MNFACDEEIGTQTITQTSKTKRITGQSPSTCSRVRVLRVRPSRPQVSEENAKLSKDKGNLVFRGTMYTCEGVFWICSSFMIDVATCK